MARPGRPPGHANRVRIVGGTFRSRVLRFDDVPGLRPTPDRVRETVFNWLGQDLTGAHCLDAFAGAGALGFEAASRHAERVVMLEKSRIAVAALMRNRALLAADRVEIIEADALAWMRPCRERFDLIFLDPPFGSMLMAAALPLAAGLLASDGSLYLEQATRISAPEGLTLYREGTAGQSHFALLKRA